MDINKKALSYFNSFDDSFNKRRGDSLEVFATNRTVPGCSCFREGKAVKRKDRNTNTCALGWVPGARPEGVRCCFAHGASDVLSAPRALRQEDERTPSPLKPRGVLEAQV